MPGQGGEDSQVEANEAAGASRKEQSLGPAHRTASTQDTHPSENHQETPRETLESPFQPGCYSTVRHSEDSANSFHTILFAAWHLRPSATAACAHNRQSRCSLVLDKNASQETQASALNLLLISRLYAHFFLCQKGPGGQEKASIVSKSLLSAPTLW